jgi:hypothetical protein
MSKIEVDAIEPQSGTTLTIGASGDTITIPSGATLSSTDPLVFPAGTVSLPAITTTGDTNTGIFFPAADTIAFTEGGTEAMRINSSGQVGIGTASPAFKLEVNKGSAGDIARFTDGVNANTVIKTSGSVTTFGPDTSNSLALQTNNTERMRIDSSGNLLYSTTSVSPHFNGDGLQISENGQLLAGQSGQLVAVFGRNTSNGEMIRFDRSGADVGSIDVTTTATSYNTSSDYRLKENVSYDFDATTRLKQLKPARFNFISNPDTTVDGFLAHEVQSIIPEAITGIKDETETKEKVVVNNIDQVIAENIEQADWEAGKIPNEEGKSQYPVDSTWEASKIVPVYQGIDQAKLTPILTKALQEAIAKIEQLEARITHWRINNFNL